jgi:hypothetical protein
MNLCHVQCVVQKPLAFHFGKYLNTNLHLSKVAFMKAHPYMIVKTFELHNVIGVTIANQIKVLIDSFGLLNNIIIK